MEFVNDPYFLDTTIAAVATPPGEGGVAIIRISGNHALTIAQKVFSGKVANYKSHTAHYGNILDSNGTHLDDGLLIPMIGQKSYTGEDTVEIHCHGGHLITRRVLEAVLEAGAKAAKPGEFTYRAYLNGKLDLAQAEAVQHLIGAKNDHALKAAENHLRGALSEKIGTFQHQLTEVAAILEAWVDFPEEGLEFATLDEMIQQVHTVVVEMNKLLATFHDGRIAQEGVSLCLVGSPNVGKSSLMNALLDKDRAIVSDIPGTTRDLLEDQFRLNGLNLRLVDTAGIRESTEAIEREGIRRSKEAMQQADLILLVLDSTRALNEEELKLLQTVPTGKTIAIFNKIDLPTLSFASLQLPHSVAVSAKSKFGLDLLRKKIDQIIWENGPPSDDEVLITNIRHKEALATAIERANAVINGLRNNLSPEFLTIEIRESLLSLGKIIGANITEDILSAIFSKFCIGK